MLDSTKPEGKQVAGKQVAEAPSRTKFCLAVVVCTFCLVGVLEILRGNSVPCISRDFALSGSLVNEPYESVSKPWPRTDERQGKILGGDAPAESDRASSSSSFLAPPASIVTSDDRTEDKDDDKIANPKTQKKPNEDGAEESNKTETIAGQEQAKSEELKHSSEANSPVQSAKSQEKLPTEKEPERPRSRPYARLLPSSRRGHEGFRFVHIAKTAGSTFQGFINRHVEKGEQKVWREDCLLGHTRHWKTYDPKKDYVASFFREPRAHVLSQYFMCEEGWYGMYDREYSQFPRPLPKGRLTSLQKRYDMASKGSFSTRMRGSIGSKSSSLSAIKSELDRAYKTQLKGFTNWMDFFLNDWEVYKGYYGCYHPLSMQTRGMTCVGEWDYLHGIIDPAYLNPDVDAAIKNMQSLWFVGVAEHFHESLCLWEYQYRGTLPIYCDCASGAKRPPFKSDSHGVAHHSVNDLSEDQLRRIDELTRHDRILYKEVIKEFMERLHEVEHTTGKTIMCNKP